MINLNTYNTLITDLNTTMDTPTHKVEDTPTTSAPREEKMEDINFEDIDPKDLYTSNETFDNIKIYDSTM